MRDRRGGYTLIELVLGTAIMAIVSVAFASCSSTYALRRRRPRPPGLGAGGHPSDPCRRSTRMPWSTPTRSAWPHRPSWNTWWTSTKARPTPRRPTATPTASPDYRDADRDNDASLLMAATAQWRVGFQPQGRRRGRRRRSTSGQKAHPDRHRPLERHEPGRRRLGRALPQARRRRRLHPSP